MTSAKIKAVIKCNYVEYNKCSVNGLNTNNVVIPGNVRNIHSHIPSLTELLLPDNIHTALAFALGSLPFP